MLTRARTASLRKFVSQKSSEFDIIIIIIYVVD